MTNVELYEALKDSIPEKAARMIAEVVPPSRELATKTDIAELKGKIDALRAEASGEMKSLPTMRWMFGMFVPMWMGVWGTVIAIVLKG